MNVDLSRYIQDNAVTEVEAFVADMAGIARGKILPAEKFLSAHGEDGLRIPEGVFAQTVTGDFVGDNPVTDPAGADIYLRPDPGTIRMIPWYPEPSAQIICDCVRRDGSDVAEAPRAVLRGVLDAYAAEGWRPVVAPELEFYLTEINADPDVPLRSPVGKSGRREVGRQAFGIDAVNEFDPIFEDLYDFCDVQKIEVDTLGHEVGAAQIEINFRHGDPLELADQAFLFKRTVREAAYRHGIYATFMAKPMQTQPGSSMHLHQSVLDANSGANLFAEADGEDSALFRYHIGGLQRYLPEAMPLFAPNVNSYRRMHKGADAPINVEWGLDNRTAALRVPIAAPAARRVENRIPGADANPYLTIAASLACGYLGMMEKREPSEPVRGSAHKRPFTLPRTLYDGLYRFNRCAPLKATLGERFASLVNAVKVAEFEAYQEVISSWERANLLLNV